MLLDPKSRRFAHMNSYRADVPMLLISLALIILAADKYALLKKHFFWEGGGRGVGVGVRLLKNITHTMQVFVDGDEPAATNQRLKSLGHFVVCYINAGAVEDYRTDALKFPSNLIGNHYYPWGEEYVHLSCILPKSSTLGSRE